jgi:hypothetical protein
LAVPFLVLSPLFPEAGIQAFQLLDPDPSLARPRTAGMARHGAFAPAFARKTRRNIAVSGECI